MGDPRNLHRRVDVGQRLNGGRDFEVGGVCWKALLESADAGVVQALRADPPGVDVHRYNQLCRC